MSLNLPDPNKVPGDGNHTSDTNLIIEAINTLKSQVDGIPAGPQGPQGEPGTPGAAGTPATVTVGSTVTSAAGGNAAVTNSGTASNAILEFTIPRGATGPQGPSGPQGAQGPAGNTGPAGPSNTLTIGNVVTGAPGSQATATITGTSPNQSLNLTIPEGDKGDTGDAATIAVGTVTTGTPGSSATITNSGTSAAAVFDFVIPRGDVGPTGPPANLSSATPQPLGVAATGTATDASRGDHVHAMPSASDVGADPAGTAASAVSTHNSDTTSVHGITDTANLVYTTDSRLSDARTPTAHASSHGAAGSDPITVAQSQVTNLSTDLSAKANLASPTFTGTPAAPTAAADTNTTQVATTAFVVGQASSTNPVVNGVAAPGTSLRYSRQDHVHPTDTSRAALASPTFTGTPAAPTAAADTNTTQIATTAYVVGQAGSSNPVMNGTVAVGTSLRYSRQDHVHPTDTSRAPLASPALTGTPTAPNAAADTNTTQVATTAYVVGQAGSSNPLVNGTVAVGTSLRYSRQDHVHPTDTSRAPLDSPTFTGTPAAPTAVTGTNTTQIATTAFVNAEISNDAVLKSLVDAKGDLLVGTADNTVARLPVGTTNGFVLTVDSNETAGVKWAVAAAPVDDPFPVGMFLGGM